MYLLQALSYISFISVTLIDQSFSNSVNNSNVINKNSSKDVLPATIHSDVSVAAEGGAVPQSLDKTHLSREHIPNSKSNFPEVPKNVTIQATAPVSSQLSNTSVTVEPAKPIVNNSVVVKNSSISSNTSSSKSELTKQNLNKTVTPSTTNKISTTTTELPRKPLKTVHDEIDPMNPNFVKSEVPPPKMSNLDPALTDKNNRRANYVVPIVAVILSVPLVAYVMSILYKRGSDWWQHRNYRRMDYLIEGMYNS